MKIKTVKKSANAAKSAAKSLAKSAPKPTAKTKSAVVSKGKLSSKSSGKSSVKSDNKPDIVDLILQDHKPIKELLEVLKDSAVEFTEKRSTFEEFMPMLKNHAEPEQETLYVRMKDENGLREDAFEGDVEHALAAQLMEELTLEPEDEDIWMAKVKVLAELVEHHIVEEEDEMLKQVRKEIDADTRYVIGQDYLNMRAEYLEASETQKPDNSKKTAEIRAH